MEISKKNEVTPLIQLTDAQVEPTPHATSSMLIIQDKANSLFSSQKPSLHISSNPLSGNSLYS